MSILSRLLSRQDARPVALYTFARGAEVWRFAGIHGGYTVPAGVLGPDAAVFEGAAVTHTGFQAGTAADKRAVKVLFPAQDPWAVQWMRPVGSAEVSLSIHIADQLDPAAGVALEWIGRMVGPVLEGDKLALVGQSEAARARDGGGLRVWSPFCAHALYRSGCGVDLEAHVEAASVTAVDGAALIVPAVAADPARWRGGVLRHAGAMRWMRRTADTGVVTLSAELPSLSAAGAGGGAVPVEIAPGCDLTAETCAARFANLERRLAFDHYSGEPLFGARSIAR